MAENTKKLFLDQSGLEIFWGIIKENFAKKSDVIDASSVNFSKTENSVTLNYSALDGTSKATELPVASETQAGIISKETYNKIDAMSGNIETAVTVKDIKIAGATILNEKVADFKLHYKSNGTENAQIQLVSSNDDTKVYSAIDVTELIKTGLLQRADLVVNPAEDKLGTYIKLVFLTTTGESELLINVSDLIDEYTAGDGINITPIGGNSGNDNQASTRRIDILAATSDKLGGIKIGYTRETGEERSYPVQLDSNNKAYVNVPWKNIVSANTNNLVITSDSDNDVKIELGADVTNAMSNANSAMQKILFLGKEYNAIDHIITDTIVKSGLGLGDSAYTGYVNDLNNAVAGKLADSNAIKTYVDNAIDGVVSGTDGFTQAIEGAIQKLDSGIEAGVSAQGAQLFFTKLVITDGILDNTASIRTLIETKDIADFGVMDKDTIESICTF